MADYESSFNATGPTVVAFETTSNDTPVQQEFGVSVVGKTCGVYGQATTGAQMDRRTAPAGTGVFGRGGNQGVYGISEAVDVDNTPDFLAAGPDLFGRFGVVGVSTKHIVDGSEANAPAVLGDNDVLSKDVRAPTNFPRVRSALDEGARVAAGVEGISWGGFGVYGISLNRGDKTTAVDLPISAGVAATAAGHIPDAINPDPTNVTAPAGVLGLSMLGAGVRAASLSDRGGIFQSATIRNADMAEPVVAQIGLVPHRITQVDATTHNPPLPRDGQTGDLLSVVAPDPNKRFQSSTLWFCERGRSTTGPAVWRKVALADTVDGT
jgi:hypothetical protein